MKKYVYGLVTTTTLLLTGCASTGPVPYNINNDATNTVEDNPLGTYSDYDHKIKYNPEDRLYHYDVYVGGTGSCDGGAILYAKPKLDKFMKENGFKSYKIIQGNYVLIPMSKCELTIDFKK